MHERRLWENLVVAVTRRWADRPVARVRVRVGVLHHAHPEVFGYARSHRRGDLAPELLEYRWRGGLDVSGNPR